MAHVARDGIQLYFEDTGSGDPILFLHEYGGDHRSWRMQVAHFAITHRCIVTAARGYPPSDVPDDEDLYGQDHAIADAFAALDHLGLESVVVVGLSMGAYTGLRMAMSAPDRIKALIAASGGSGSFPTTHETFASEAAALADEILAVGHMPADKFAEGPTRTQLKRKDRDAWEEFRTYLGEHPAIGAAYTMRHVQGKRPPLTEFEAELAACPVPTLLVAGDEDEACIDINVWLKRAMPMAGLLMLPKSGHLINLEDPDGFNAHIEDFLAAVDAGAWPVREAVGGSFGGVGPVSED